MKVDWGRVAQTLHDWASTPALGWQFGQEDGLRWLADRIESAKGLLIADEVGLGKTRLAVAAMHAVTLAGGRVCAVAPSTLLHQWEDEYASFLEAIGTPEAPDTDKTARQLRNFNDLFRPKSRYPLCANHPFILISHTFGIPQRIGGGSRPYIWALPFIVRSFHKHGLENWNGAKGLQGAATEKRLGLQLPAARWLSKRTRGLDAAFDALPPLNNNAGAAFSDVGERSRRLRQLLQTLVGRLMGPFDLIVIDEAHKSREDVVVGDVAFKRLTGLLEETIVSSLGALRLGLTATPVQLAASDWGKTLQRIGFYGEDLEARKESIARFDATCLAHRAGPASDDDVNTLCKAAKTFEDALADVVVRRRWSDQRLMAAARKAFDDEGAHPHRAWKQVVLAWDRLPDVDRMAFLAAEGRALSSRKTSLGIVERHRAARHAQAMEAMDASETAYTVAADGPDDLTAKTPYHTYWVSMQDAMRARHSADGDGGLVRHPRIAEACSSIENVTKAGNGKVLVFANYNRPLVALSNALNVRRFLREVAAGTPTLMPLIHNAGEAHGPALVSGVLASMEDRDEIRRAGDLDDLIAKSSIEYRRRSDALAGRIDRVLGSTQIVGSARVALRLAALEWMLDRDGEDAGLDDKIRDLARRLAILPSDDPDRPAVAKSALVAALDAEAGYADVNRSTFARIMVGGGKASTRRVLQALFNTSNVRPQVLVAQSRVAAEGLNLHVACRHVLFLHLDWNPATIEQQIGRVDRVGSLWAQDFAGTPPGAAPPRIELATIVIDGTSDSERQRRILQRQHALGAHLFGELLPPAIMRGLNPEWRLRLQAASPSFSPSAYRGVSGAQTDRRR